MSCVCFGVFYGFLQYNLIYSRSRAHARGWGVYPPHHPVSTQVLLPPARVLAFIGPWDWPNPPFLLSREGGANTHTPLGKRQHWRPSRPPPLFMGCMRYACMRGGKEAKTLLTYDPIPLCLVGVHNTPPTSLRCRTRRAPKGKNLPKTKSPESLAPALAPVKSTSLVISSESLLFLSLSNTYIIVSHSPRHSAFLFS